MKFAAAFATFAREQAGALLVGADPYFNSQRALLIVPVAQLRLPAIYEWREFAEAGGLMSYGTSRRIGRPVTLSGGRGSGRGCRLAQQAIAKIRAGTVAGSGEAFARRLIARGRRA
jgi:hypothetical protein